MASRIIIASAIASLGVAMFALPSKGDDVRADTARNSPRIFFGRIVEAGQGPWAAWTKVTDDPADPHSYGYTCAGSFVSPNLARSGSNWSVRSWRSDDPNPTWLVTAAHCSVDSQGRPIKPERITILGGTLDRSKPGDGEVQGVLAVLPHPTYSSATLADDIAILKLKAPSKGLEPVQRASIRLPAVYDTYWINEPYLAVRAQGWGRTEGGDTSLLLKEALLPIVDRALCRYNFGKYDEAITDGMLCAGFVDGNFNSCQGDSGGPLVYRSEGTSPVALRSATPVLLGVVSWGIGCGSPDLFGIYSSTSYYRKWIESRIAGYLEAGK